MAIKFSLAFYSASVVQGFASRWLLELLVRSAANLSYKLNFYKCRQD